MLEKLKAFLLNLKIVHKIYLFMAVVVFCLLLFGTFYFSTITVLLQSIESKEKAFSIKEYFYEITRDLDNYTRSQDPQYLNKIDKTFVLLEKDVAWLAKNVKQKGQFKDLNLETIQNAQEEYQAFIHKFDEVNKIIQQYKKQLQQLTEDVENKVIKKTVEAETQFFIVNTMRKYLNQSIDLKELQIVGFFRNAGVDMKTTLEEMGRDTFNLTGQFQKQSLENLRKKNNEELTKLRDEFNYLKQLLDEHGNSESDLLEVLLEESRSFVESLKQNLQEMDNTYSQIISQLEDNRQLFAKLPETAAHVAQITDHFYKTNQFYAETIKQSSQKVMGVVFILTLAVLIFFGILITNSVIGPVKVLIRKVKEISEGEGDLTNYLEVNSRDEIGELCRYFNRFLEALKFIISSISANTTQSANISRNLSGVSEEISSSTKEMSYTIRQVNSQAKNLSSLTTANKGKVNQLHGYIQAVAAAQENINQNLQDVKEGIKDGMAISQQTGQAIGEIRNSVTASREIVEELLGKSRQISEIMEVIKGLAKQTNLLAINSSIEAARVGEEGKGFSVIANEIREFSNRTHQATGNIEEILNEISQGTNEVMESMNNSAVVVNEGTKVVDKTLAIFSTIGNGINALIPKLQEIEKSSQEQLGISKYIQEEVTEEAEFINQNTKVTEEVTESIIQVDQAIQSIAQTSHDLLENSENLIEMVKKFKV